MSLYTPRQLLLIVLLVGAAGAGLAIDHARRARPDLAERLERWIASSVRSPRRVPILRRRAGHARDAPSAPARPLASTPARRVREPPPAEPLDVNHASEPELARLPGVGPALAARIVAARPFADVDELRRVRGLRRGLFERLRPLVAALP